MAKNKRNWNEAFEGYELSDDRYMEYLDDELNNTESNNDVYKENRIVFDKKDKGKGKTEDDDSGLSDEKYVELLDTILKDLGESSRIKLDARRRINGNKKFVKIIHIYDLYKMTAKETARRMYPNNDDELHIRFRSKLEKELMEEFKKRPERTRKLIGEGIKKVLSANDTEINKLLDGQGKMNFAQTNELSVLNSFEIVLSNLLRNKNRFNNPFTFLLDENTSLGDKNIDRVLIPPFSNIGTSEINAIPEMISDTGDSSYDSEQESVSEGNVNIGEQASSSGNNLPLEERASSSRNNPESSGQESGQGTNTNIVENMYPTQYNAEYDTETYIRRRALEESNQIVQQQVDSLITDRHELIHNYLAEGAEHDYKFLCQPEDDWNEREGRINNPNIIRRFF